MKTEKRIKKEAGTEVCKTTAIRVVAALIPRPLSRLLALTGSRQGWLVMMLTKRHPWYCDAFDRVTCLYKAFHLKWPSWIRFPPPCFNFFFFSGVIHNNKPRLPCLCACDWLLITERLQCGTLSFVNVIFIYSCFCCRWCCSSDTVVFTFQVVVG